ncbi:FrbG [Streptomyces rubellomurinus subsp. indigoferus]|nr:FrbG [Streptomyces rubellomurinus subsp. indigoferus]
MTHYATVICGGGPAGVSAVVAAAVQGRLEEFLDRGVLLVEATGRAGSGSIPHYGIRANSLGSAFLECLDGPAGSGLLAGLADSAEARELRGWADEYPPLPVVGAFLTLVGERVVDALRRHPRCDALLGHRVVEVRTGPERATVLLSGPDGELSHTGDRVLLTMGGRERTELAPDALAALVERRPGLRVLSSGEVITDPSWHPDAASPHRALGSIAVLGGAHSAWAVAAHLARLARAGWFAGPVEVTVVERRLPPIFYFSAAEARAEGYRWDEADVCGPSGRVHRFGGLRGPARELARQVMGLAAEKAPDGFGQVVLDGPWTAEALEAAVGDADLVITALGYDARLPRLLGADGRELELARPRGAVDTGRDGLPGLAAGGSAERLVMYGLGAGLVPSEETGGEPGYRGRLDGVWVYQHDIGAVILRALLANDRTEEGR